MGEIVKYEAEGLEGFSVLLDSETVWLTQAQMSILFDRDRTVIGRHIRNVFVEEELEENEVCAFFAHTTQHGAMADKTQTTSMQYYNLDVIISVGYRVKSKQGTRFRRWATRVLREHLLKGYTVKQPASVEQLNEVQGQINKMLQRQDMTDLLMYEEFGRVYEIISEITEQKRLQEATPRKKIGFRFPHEENDEK